MQGREASDFRPRLSEYQTSSTRRRPLSFDVSPTWGEAFAHGICLSRTGDSPTVNMQDLHCDRLRPVNHTPGMATHSAHSVHSIISGYIERTWRMVRAGELKPRTMVTYASMTGIVPSGLRFTSQGAGNRNFGAIWGHDVRSLTASDLRRWMLDVAEDVRENRAWGQAGVTTANRCLILLDSALKWAISEGLVPPHCRPTAAVKKFTEAPRTRYLEPDEVQRLREALLRVESIRVISARADRRPFAYSVTQALLLISLTAMRLQEALTLRVADVNLAGRVLKLPDSKTGYSEVPLSEAAVDLLRAQLPRAHGGWVFPSLYGGPVSSVYEIWAEVLIDSGIDTEGVVIHTLRHTVASLMKRGDVPLDIIQQVLRHKDPRTTQKAYIHVTVTRGVLAATDRYAAMVAPTTGGEA